MAVQASKLISLTILATGSTLKLSADKIVRFTASGSNTLLTYITNRDRMITKLVTEDVATINTAAARTQALTLDDADSTVIYFHSDKIIFADDNASNTGLVYWNPGVAAPEVYAVTESASDINTAAGNTLAITIQASGVTRYINNLFIEQVNVESVSGAPVITFTTKVKTATGVVTTAGSGYTAPTVTITGGGGSGAAGTVTTKAVSATPAAAGTGYVVADTITLTGGTFTTTAILAVATTKPVTLATNAAGSSYDVADTILTAGGTASTHATLTVTHVKVVTAPAVVGGSPGSGFVTGDTVSFTTDGTGTPAVFVVTAAAGAVTSLSSISNAGDYTVKPALSATKAMTAVTGIGTGLEVVLVAADFGVKTASITTAGSYTVNSASFTQNTSSGAGTGATFNTVVYGVNTVTVGTAGSYTVVPTNPVAQGATSGSGTGATFTSSFGINTFLISAAGTGYTSYPTFTVVDDDGVSAVITASMTVESPMTIVDGGVNINTTPILTFSATTGTLATATATVTEATQTVTSTTLTAAGAYKKGTDAYPTLAISGGAGCQILYDTKRTGFIKLQVAETAATVQTAVNAL